jgi:hypothetical protein
VPTVERGFLLTAFCSIVHFWFFHLADELAGVGREGLDVAPLALRVQRVEGQRGLAAARDAGDHHQLKARQPDVDVLQVVFLGSTDQNLVIDHSRWFGLRRWIRVYAAAQD